MYFASGESLYAGAALILLAIVLSPLLVRRWQRLLRNVAVWLGLVLMVMASPPFSWIVDIGFLAAFMLWLGAELRIERAPVRAIWRIAMARAVASARSRPPSRRSLCYLLLSVGSNPVRARR